MTESKHIHVIGIGGSAMAPLAGMLRERGFRVTGSDSGVYPPASTLLESLGISFFHSFHAANLTPAPAGIPYYDQVLFVRTIRTGFVGSRPLNPLMPWSIFRNMTDDDLDAIFAYLKTLKPVSHRVDNSMKATLCPLDGAMHGAGDQNRSSR